MASLWTENGPAYGLSWGDLRWTLDVDATIPGLLCEEATIGPLLALDGLSSPGRDEPRSLSGGSLIRHECRLNRVEALYQPSGWHSLRVRATWTPRDVHILDLELQLQADTVDEIMAVQAHVTSSCGVLLPSDPSRPSVTIREGSPNYLEMSHPDDTARIDVIGSGKIRYGLLGYDLERGVVLRARLRGIWLANRPEVAEISRQYQLFLDEPLPLGT